MTALDRAFVKAYQRRGPTTVSADSEAERSAETPSAVSASAPAHATPPEPHMADVFSALQQGPAPSATARLLGSPRPAGSKDLPVVRPSGVRIRVDRELNCPAPTLEQFAGRPAAASPAFAPPADVAPPPLVPALPIPVSEPLVELPPPNPDAVATPVPAAVAPPEAPPAPGVEPSVVEPFVAETFVAEMPSLLNTVSEVVSETTAMLAPLAEPLTASPPPQPTQFLPALQVDAFLWPDVCLRMEQQAGPQLDALADELIGSDRRQHRVVAVAGVQPGVGCSTLALCLARRLAGGGLRVALVDADLASPALARQLGLDVECGWEQPLAGLCPLESVLVESVDDRLTLLPRLQALELDALTALRAEDHLNRLREQYDAIVLDWGALDAATETDELAWRRQAARPDLVLLVDDTRAASTGLREALAARLEDETVAVVENFVSG